METRYVVLRPELPTESGTIEWPLQPTAKQVADLIRPLLDGGFPERVKVLADPSFFRGTRATWKTLDMLVDDQAVPKRLPINTAATILFQRTLDGAAGELASIRGPAVVFSRGIWPQS